MRDDEIKELDKEIPRQVLKLLKEYIDLIDPSNSDKITELHELNIAQKYLRSPYFEKRVRGINDLKEIYQKVVNSQKTRQ